MRTLVDAVMLHVSAVIKKLYPQELRSFFFQYLWAYDERAIINILLTG